MAPQPGPWALFTPSEKQNAKVITNINTYVKGHERKGSIRVGQVLVKDPSSLF
jgi:hypothetical protein